MHAHALPNPGPHDVDVIIDEARALASLLVEFDPMLARELRDHLEARAQEWERSPSARRRNRERAIRYRELAQLIDAFAPLRGLRD